MIEYRLLIIIGNIYGCVRKILLNEKKKVYNDFVELCCILYQIYDYKELKEISMHLVFSSNLISLFDTINFNRINFGK